MSADGWLCPLCAQERVPYGKSCQRGGLSDCEHVPQDLHIAGRIYYERWLKRQAHDDAAAIGIGAIADEGM